MNLDENILILIHEQLDNFPSLRGLVKKLHLRPSVVFSPITLESIVKEMNINPGIGIEAIDFLDLIGLYSLMTYKDGGFFTSSILSVAITNRLEVDSTGKLPVNHVNDLTINSIEDFKSFMDNNKYLLGIYIYTVVLLGLGAS